MIGKRGLSDIVTTVLIILLAVAAVAVVWGYVLPSLKKTGSQLSTDCINLNLEPTSCKYNATTNEAIVKVKRDTGEAKLSGMKYILEVGGNSVAKDSALTPAVFESTSESVALSGAPAKLEVAGIVLLSSGESKTCERSAVSVPCEKL